MPTPHDLYGLSDEYWARITPRDKRLYALIRPMRQSVAGVDWFFNNIESNLNSLEKYALESGGAFELIPDFQRGHVWDEARQVAYVENLFRGTAPYQIKFNCPGWSSLDEPGGDLHRASAICIDGLQRLTAVRRFIAGEISVFNEETYESLRGTAFHPGSMRLRVEIFNFNWRADLLQFYLDLNRGGVVHSPDELQRVERLLQETRRSATPPAAVETPSPSTKTRSSKRRAAP